MDVLWKAERYELITHIAKLIIPSYEKRHEYTVKYRQRFAQRVSSLARIVFESLTVKSRIDASLYRLNAGIVTRDPSL